MQHRTRLSHKDGEPNSSPDTNKGLRKTWNSNLSLEACINVHIIKNSVINTEKSVYQKDQPVNAVYSGNERHLGQC